MGTMIVCDEHVAAAMSFMTMGVYVCVCEVYQHTWILCAVDLLSWLLNMCDLVFLHIFVCGHWIGGGSNRHLIHVGLLR